ncbi:AaceriAFR371Wp [[Ashbya] aceris (nom. inval.)]|nr:AaceriAFR371Wp [[Ashbya] aceris (nom. inval.)]
MTAEQSLEFFQLRVVYSDAIRGNFVRLPGNVISVLESTSIPVHEFGIQVQPGGWYVGWDGHESQQSVGGHPVLEVNPVLGGELGVQVGQVVDIRVKHYGEQAVATEVYVEPEGSDDWEVIEANAMFFQDEMLFQTRIVSPGAKLVCYVDRIVARCRVQRVVPESLAAARLSTDTLVVVAPRVNRARKAAAPTALEPLPVPEKPKTLGSVLLRSTFHTTSHPRLSVEVPYGNLQSAVAFLSVVRNPLELKAPSSKEDNVTQPARRIAVEVFESAKVPAGHVSLSPSVWQCLAVTRDNGEKVKLEFAPDVTRDDLVVSVHKANTDQKGKKVVIGGVDSLNHTLLRSAENLMAEMQGGILTNKLLFPEQMLLVELKCENGGKLDYARLTSGDKLAWNLSKHEVEVPATDIEPAVSVPKQMVAVDDLIKGLVDSLAAPIGKSCHYVYGPSGMGKTSLLREVEYRLLLEHCYSTKFVNCAELQETNSVAKMKQFIQQTLAIAYWKAPTVVFLDNADFLFPSLKSNDEGAGNNPGNAMSQTSTKLAHIFNTELGRICQKRTDAVRVVLAAEKADSLNAVFSTKHAIGHTWPLTAPGRHEREVIVAAAFRGRGLQFCDSLNAADVALDTEGYSPADLETLVDKIFHETLCRADPGSPLVADRATFDQAFQGYTSASLRGIKLQKSTGVRWSDIGALDSAKRLLLETLEWPTRYAPIFSQCPLRLRSGILLYGYPGCGKTMLASAVAQQCGLNFITVKGPEILNKYIGASEQSVRDLFEKAQAAKPCVLFFDEFDSIAPKRGHDSTGVTDRVVNQMLTQMDGAEGLDGVYVLAATSRPDLIDSALLRPGRLDKSVLCGMPSAAERAAILRAIVTSGAIALAPNVNLAEIAERAAGFSGADLQGMCYNAYLKAVHRALHARPTTRPRDPTSAPPPAHVQLNASNNAAALDTLARAQEILGARGRNPEQAATTHTPAETPVASFEDMLAACAETKPSISSTERAKLQRIYAQFVSERNGDMPNGEAPDQIGTRATLM